MVWAQIFKTIAVLFIEMNIVAYASNLKNPLN